VQHHGLVQNVAEALAGSLRGRNRLLELFKPVNHDIVVCRGWIVRTEQHREMFSVRHHVIEGLPETGNRLTLAHPKLPVGKPGREDLDGVGGVEARVPGPVYLAHATSAEGGLDFIGSEFGARGEGHARAITIKREEILGHSDV
jgi:hypothetical protein